MGLRPVTPRTISDQVADQLRELIRSGEFKPGDRIPSERALAATLDVGRPALREALRELKSQGLLISGRGAQGTTVASVPSPSFGPSLTALMGQGAERIIELMEIRSAVEIEAAGLAARRATLEDLHRLAEIVSGTGNRLSPDDDVAFHAAIARATHNPLFETVIQEPVDLLHDHMAAILSAYYLEPGGGGSLQQQHDAIRRAIRSGNEQQAREAMRHHLDYVARGLAQLVGTGRVMRLIFIDLEGTLLSGPRRISERAKKAIANVREAGIEVVLVSSRAPRAVRPFHQQLGLMTPLVACNGALLWSFQTDAGLAHISVPGGLARELVAVGREAGAVVGIESDDESFSDPLSELTEEEAPDDRPATRAVTPSVDDLLGSDEPIDKVFLDLQRLDERVASSLIEGIHRDFGRRVTIYEITPRILEITSIEASKAVMAQRLARNMQITAEQTMAIGDHDSDASLLLWAGIGVAMGNATPAAKASADVITSSSLRDGVAEALEHWVLGKKSLGATVSVPNPSMVPE